MGMNRRKYAMGIMGLGRVGSVLAVRTIRAGLPVAAAWDPDPDKRRKLAAMADRAIPDAPEAFRLCRVLFLCVPDDLIADVMARIHETQQCLPGTVVAHTSGAFGPGIFPENIRRTYSTGAFHPMMAFPPDPRDALPFEGIGFGIDGDETARNLLDPLAALLGGFAVHVPESMRGLYHTAAVMASNFTVYLEQIAGDLLARAGLAPAAAADMLDGLQRSVRHNIAGSGAGKTLSGPAVRGDLATIRRHRDALRHHAPELLPLYEVLTRAVWQFCGNTPPLPSLSKSAKVTADLETEGTHDEKSDSSGHKDNT